MASAERDEAKLRRYDGRVRLMIVRPHLPLRPGNERLNDRPTIIIQQVHLIDDEQAHGSRHAAAQRFQNDAQATSS